MPWIGQSRLEFECLNQRDSYAKSFKKDGICADVAIEVSSQGELQQVIALIHFLVKKSKRIELIYASESLEKDIMELQSKLDRNDLRCLRLPVIKRSLFRDNQANIKAWVSAKSFIFVRYDFYPHLIDLCFGRKLNTILLWGSLKNKELSGIGLWYWRNLTGLFQTVFAANNQNAEEFKKLNNQIEIFSSEMRVLAIEERLIHAEKKFEEKHCSEFIHKLRQTGKQNFIMGSAYFDDLILFQDQSVRELVQNGSTQFIIAPHHLDTYSLNQICLSLRQLKLPFLVISQDEDIKDIELKDYSIILFTGKGVLCELYRCADIVYVGGGFQKSIHSVLEPFWAGCSVICGPKTHRSTEYDLCMEIDSQRIAIIENHGQLAQRIGELDSFKNQFNNREKEKITAEKEHLVKINELIGK